MRRVGIIDNLVDIDSFLTNGFPSATPDQIMRATGGNTGNIAFVHGVKKIIGNKLTRVDWSFEPAYIRNKVDHLVICCANQLGSHVDLGGWADRLQKFGLPVTLIGIGAQADSINEHPKLPEGTLRFLEVVKELAPSNSSNIASRGKFTTSVINHHGINASPLGCPSLHVSKSKNLGKQILSRQNENIVKKIAIAAGNPWHAISAPLEHKLCEIVNEYSGEYIIQHPISMVQCMFGDVTSINEKTRERFRYIYKKHDFDEVLSWYRTNASLYVEVGAWMLALNRSDFVLGPRYHGVALGLQTGVPGTVIAIDSRTTELCQGTGVKYLELTQALAMTPQEIIASARWSRHDADVFDDRRSTSAKDYIEFLLSNELQPSSHLEELSL